MITLQGLSSAAGPVEIVRQRLDRDIGDPEPETGRDAEQEAALDRKPIDLVRDDQREAQPDGDRLEDDQPPRGVLGASSSPSRASGERHQAQRDRHQADPDPLATFQREPEEALGQHGEKDESSREHRLADRERGKGERRDVQRKRHHRHTPADRPPSRSKEVGRATQRMAHVDVRSGDCALVLQQEGEVRTQRGQQRAE